MKNMNKIIESYHEFQEQEKEVFKNFLKVYNFLEKDIERTLKSFKRINFCFRITGEEIFSIIQPKLTKEIEKLKKAKAEFEEREGFKIEYNTFKEEGYIESTVPELANTLFAYGKDVTQQNIKKKEWENIG